MPKNCIRFSYVDLRGTRVTGPFKGLVTRVPHKPTHEKRWTFNACKNIDVDKGEKYHAQTTQITQ